MKEKKPAAPRPDRGYLITEDNQMVLRRMAEQVQMAAVLIAPRTRQDDAIRIPVHILPVTEILYEHARRLRKVLNEAHHIYVKPRRKH